MPRRIVGSTMFEWSSEDHLSIKKDGANFATVTYQPSRNKLKESKTYAAPKQYGKAKRKLLEVSGTNNHLTIYPLNTLPTHSDFLQPKYEQIESIRLEGFDYEVPRSVGDVENILNELPSGFVKDHDYGLGLMKDYRFIIHAIENIPKIKHLIISKNNDTGVSEEIYTLSFADYDSIRKGINRIALRQQKDGAQDKWILAHNSLLTHLDAKKYPEKARAYKKDAIFKLIATGNNRQVSLSEADQNAAIRLVDQNKKEIAQKAPQQLLQLRKDIELVTLEVLIQEFEAMLAKDLPEARWQGLFNDNPFILSLAFGFPIIAIKDLAFIGGKTFSGAGGKITDFLVKNNLTDNSALVEIKTPKAKLLTGEYRGGICRPSPELGGAINQLLDQRYRFQKEISSLKDNSGIHDVESYSVSCVLIIGKMPEGKEQRKTFELFRGNSKEIDIVTFDELLEKLRHLHLFLSLDLASPRSPIIETKGTKGDRRDVF